jgi:hypothetical protein
VARQDNGAESGSRRRLVVLALAAVVVLVVVVPASVLVLRYAQQGSLYPPAPRTSEDTHPFAPTPPILWGMWIKDADRSGDPTPIIAAREATLGHRLDVFHWYESWDSNWSKVAGRVDTIAASGRIPMITWEAFDHPVDRIAGGAYDGYIDTWAKGAASNKPHTIWIRIFHEFNDPSSNGGYPWSIEANSPASLIAAWRHVHDRFAAAGADNVKWVWNPDGVNVDKTPSAYPGDQYVDYTGWDTYGYDNAKDYGVIAAISKKPMVIGEFGPGDGPDSGLGRFTEEIAKGSYPLLHAVVFFDEGKYSVASNPSVRDSLKQMLASDAFKGGGSPSPTTR